MWDGCHCPPLAYLLIPHLRPRGFTVFQKLFLCDFIYWLNFPGKFRDLFHFQFFCEFQFAEFGYFWIFSGNFRVFNFLWFLWTFYRSRPWSHISQKLAKIRNQKILKKQCWIYRRNFYTSKFTNVTIVVHPLARTTLPSSIWKCITKSSMDSKNGSQFSIIKNKDSKFIFLRKKVLVTHATYRDQFRFRIVGFLLSSFNNPIANVY